LSTIPIFLEEGSKKVFAGAIDWPGWVRSGAGIDQAIQALVMAAPRYATAMQAAGLDFPVIVAADDFVIVERHPGSATTDFGAPVVMLNVDADAMDEADLLRGQALLQGCWAAFDAAVQQATGHELRKGPRGGGRDLEKIVRHVLESDAAYLISLGWKPGIPRDLSPDEHLPLVRAAILQGLAVSAHGEIPERGPRGGVRWKPRYYLRNVAWHTLDHAWEIEDRIV
jgi:hypothetical protein